jgi:uncharacterized protein (DUF927 family)
MLAVSVAFAAPLLALVDEEGGGIHFRGISSIGKSTVLLAAGSVWGGGERPSYMQRWRATANGLEAIAEAHNDCLLVLDELGQIDPREAGDVAYLLANGTGKQRANRGGGARGRKQWRLMFLSAGEIGLRDHMQAGGRRTTAGQELRMADIPMDAGAGLGGFETLHGFASPDAFARAIREAANQHYGTPIRAFLEQLVKQDPAAVTMEVQEIRKLFLERVVPGDAAGEVYRLAGRFALIATAGEAAIEAGVLPWPARGAFEAAVTCFKAWLEGRGGHGAGDVEAAIAKVRAFIELHGASRFESLDGPSDHQQPIYDRAGFKRQDSPTGMVEYLIMSETFRKHVCDGFDPATTAKALAERGYLVRGEEGRLQDRVRVSGARVRVYRVRSTILEG